MHVLGGHKSFLRFKELIIRRIQGNWRINNETASELSINHGNKRYSKGLRASETCFEEIRKVMYSWTNCFEEQ
jgi:hypothetical protein